MYRLAGTRLWVIRVGKIWTATADAVAEPWLARHDLSDALFPRRRDAVQCLAAHVDADGDATEVTAGFPVGLRRQADGSYRTSDGHHLRRREDMPHMWTLDSPGLARTMVNTIAEGELHIVLARELFDTSFEL